MSMRLVLMDNDSIGLEGFFACSSLSCRHESRWWMDNYPHGNCLPVDSVYYFTYTRKWQPLFPHSWMHHKTHANTWRSQLYPGRLTWNLLINHLERKMIFQTSMIMFHGNLPGCILFGSNLNSLKMTKPASWSQLVALLLSKTAEERPSAREVRICWCLEGIYNTKNPFAFIKHIIQFPSTS